MQTYKAVYQKDINGDDGWILRGFENTYSAAYSPAGRLLAHDILEHNPENPEVSVAAELKAIGAACWGRMNLGFDVTRDGILNDIAVMYQELNGAILPLIESPIIDPDNVDLSELFAALQRKYDIDEQTCASMRPYMAIGIKDAMARYGEPKNLVELFASVSSAIDEAQDMAGQEVFSGLEMQICVDYEKLNVSVKILYDEGFDEDYDD